MIVATAGKGGVGKTTVIATLARLLQSQGKPFAVVDADPVGMVGMLLGAEDRMTVTQAIERDVRQDTLTQAQLDKLLAPLPDGGVLLRMGYHQRDGCFCRANTLTRLALAQIVRAYPVVLMDSEAGLEHVTRGTSAMATHLVLVADESRAALEVARSTLETMRALMNNGGQERTRGAVHLLIRTDAVEGSMRHEALSAQARALELPQPRLIPNSQSIAFKQANGEPLPQFQGSNLNFYVAVQSWANRIFNGVQPL